MALHFNFFSVHGLQIKRIIIASIVYNSIIKLDDYVKVWLSFSVRPCILIGRNYSFKTSPSFLQRNNNKRLNDEIIAYTVYGTMTLSKKKIATIKSMQKDVIKINTLLLFRLLFKSISDCVEALMLCLGIVLGTILRTLPHCFQPPISLRITSDKHHVVREEYGEIKRKKEKRQHQQFSLWMLLIF